MAKLKFFFRAREQLVVRRGQIRGIGWMIMKYEAQVFQVLGCKCPLSGGILVQEQDYLEEIPAAIFLQNVTQFQQQG